MDMNVDPAQLLAKFEKDLPNLGNWYWNATNGSRAHTLTAIQKLSKAGVKDNMIADVITDLFFAAYVEYEQQILAKTGVRIKELTRKPDKAMQPAESCQQS